MIDRPIVAVGHGRGRLSIPVRHEVKVPVLNGGAVPMRFRVGVPVRHEVKVSVPNRRAVPVRFRGRVPVRIGVDVPVGFEGNVPVWNLGTVPMRLGGHLVFPIEMDGRPIVAECAVQGHVGHGHLQRFGRPIRETIQGDTLGMSPQSRAKAGVHMSRHMQD